jgi:hypothetical protein
LTYSGPALLTGEHRLEGFDCGEAALNRSRDIYFEEVWPADAHGQISNEFAVRRGVWLDSAQIDALFFMEPPDALPPLHKRVGGLLGGWWRRIRGSPAPSPTTPPISE